MKEDVDFIAIASFILLIQIVIVGHSKYSSFTKFIFPGIILFSIWISSVAFFGFYETIIKAIKVYRQKQTFQKDDW